MVLTTIILDGVGIGAQHDADQYGDEHSNTLANICRVARPRLPNLAALGLGNIRPLDGIEPNPVPRSSYGIMQEISAGKDSTTGHWELAGIPLDRPFPTYPGGFPEELVKDFADAIARDAVLGNCTASGTEIINRLGQQHIDTGLPIVYTSADSVFQIAAHAAVVPVEQLYTWCEIARTKICIGAHAVGRVIARPFDGAAPNFIRISERRKDFSLPPPKPPVQEILRLNGVRTVAIGKISDLFADVGFDASYKTKANAEGITITADVMGHAVESGTPTFIWTNLVDFDQEFGHRNDVFGFARALEAFDRSVPKLCSRVADGGTLILTADHGNDPTTPSTDHSRESVPLLVFNRSKGRSLGDRGTFADHAASIAAFFNVAYEGPGTSFL